VLFDESEEVVILAGSLSGESLTMRSGDTDILAREASADDVRSFD
jgi:hypothetical protein